jgi:hypothetical protein
MVPHFSKVKLGKIAVFCNTFSLIFNKNDFCSFYLLNTVALCYLCILASQITIWWSLTLSPSFFSLLSETYKYFRRKKECLEISFIRNISKQIWKFFRWYSSSSMYSNTVKPLLLNTPPKWSTCYTEHLSVPQSEFCGRVKWAKVGMSQTGVHNPYFTIFFIYSVETIVFCILWRATWWRHR